MGGCRACRGGGQWINAVENTQLVLCLREGIFVWNMQHIVCVCVCVCVCARACVCGFGGLGEAGSV